MPSTLSQLCVAGTFLVGALLYNLASVSATDWDQWHGPNRDLVSTESGWRTNWKEKPPAVAWRAQVGVGFSSLAVSAGRVYTLGHKRGKETMYCFDAANGREVWKHSYKCKLIDYLHEGGPGATPTVDGDHVYSVSNEGEIYCFDKAKGDVVWRTDLRRAVGAKVPDWGFSSSPLILGDRLIVDAGPLVAIDKTSGDVTWQTKAYVCGYGSPVALKVGNTEHVAVLNNTALILARANDGRVMDEYKWKTSYNTSASSPRVAENTLFISTGYDQGCALLKVTPKAKLRQVYRNKRMRNHMNSSVYYEDHFYGFDGNSSSDRTVTLKCMDRQSGKVRWTQRGLGCGSLMIAAGKLVILSSQGELVIANATPKKYEEIARTRALKGRCWTVPVLSNGRIYCRNTPGEVVCLDVRE